MACNSEPIRELCPGTRIFSGEVNHDNRHVVRWYVMVNPSGNKTVTAELDLELKRRSRDGEPLFEYFAPTFVSTKRVNGRLVSTRRPLLYNYLFVHASECEIYRTKQRLPKYNFLPRVKDGNDEYHYPYLSDEAMRRLQWIARSYSDSVPVCPDDSAWLSKGDTVRITEGRFKGAEARVVSFAPSRHKEIVVSIDDWICVPLLKVLPGQYEVVRLNPDENRNYAIFNDDRLQTRLHEALCRYHSGVLTDEDRDVAADVLRRYANITVDSDVMRSKLYSLLLPAYTVLEDSMNKARMIGCIQGLLSVIKAEQSRALLLVTLYGCTDSCIYCDMAHEAVSQWKGVENLKKSKLQLMQRLTDYDRSLKHEVL